VFLLTYVFRNSGRDFFKLPRIELRCEISPTKTIVVEPQVDAAPEPVIVEESSQRPASPVQAIGERRISVPTDDMEVDTRPVQHASHSQPPSAGIPQHHHRHGSLHEQHHHHHHHQPLRQVEANRQSLPPPSARSPTAPVHSINQKSPSNPLPSPSPSVKPVHDVQYVQQPQHHPQPKEVSVGLTNRTRDLPPVPPHVQSPLEQHRTNGQQYPRSPQDVKLDAIERLQTQISQNSSALTVQSRDMRRYEGSLQHQEENLRGFQGQLHQQSTEIRRVDEAVGRLQHEMRGIREMLEVLSREVQTTREATGRGIIPGAPISAQDTALELMASQVSVVSQKANEVDTLKITIEIMKNKIQRLEETAVAPPVQPELQSQQRPQVQQHTQQPAQQPAQQPSSQHAFQSPREVSAHPVQPSHAVQPYHSTPSSVAHINNPHPGPRLQSFHSHGSHTSTVASPEISQRPEPTATQSSVWVTVNAGAKRAHTNGVDGPHDPIGQPLGSPKRPKLATLEPRAAFENAQGLPHVHQQHVYDNMDDDCDSRIQTQTHSHTLPSSHQPPREPLPESNLSSQHPQPAFVPYGTQDGPSDDSWPPESQRIVESRTPRGRGRGGGPGSRGGRGRKSLPAHVQLGTPEWEKEEWQGMTDAQASPNEFYSPLGRSRGGGGIVRRGSGGGGPGSRGGRPPSSSGRPESRTGSRAVSLGRQGVTMGVGIAGMPGMDPYAHTKKTRTKPIRNADGILIRKDGRPDMRSQSSAANLRKVHARKEELKEGEQGYSPRFRETSSPTSFLPPGSDLTASVQKKHNFVMNKMFPRGVEESRKAEDNARKVLEEETGHAQAHVRGHHGHHREIKREQVEESMASQSPNDGDVDMDQGEDGQTLSEGSGRESQYHDATSNDEERLQAQNASVQNGVRDLQSTGQTPQTGEGVPMES
jgi:hypothetical protein